MSSDALPIEDYAVLGDTETAALVGRDGSIDWLCLPRFDSPACFAALLGSRDNGRWLAGPAGPARTTRRCVGDSFVLEIGSGAMISAVAGPDMLVLRDSRLPVAADGRHEDEFEVAAGERMAFSTTWFSSHEPVPPPLDVGGRVKQTVGFWEDWVRRCDHTGPYREAVVRSLLVLRVLTHGTTGGIMAAPTTSLPERLGGPRNWDYRFCWLRDASLTLEALLRSGYDEEIVLWRDWLLRAVAGDPQEMQIMYVVDGSRELPERQLGHLGGYADSRPVRVGNAAADQRQTDVLGEVMAALDLAREQGLEDPPDSWALQRALVRNLARHWDEPDNGLWEIRGSLRHFTHSRVMVWVAMDRAVKAVERHGLNGPVDTWRELRAEVDASLLVLPAVGFIAADDPRFLGTLRVVEQDLIRDGLVLRYRTEEYDPLNARMVGNFPQAFSHLALIGAALALREAERTDGDGPSEDCAL